MPKRSCTQTLHTPISKKQKSYESEKIVVARTKLIAMLECFERDDTSSDAPQSFLAENVGAITFREDKGEKFACAFSLMRDMLENGEVDNNRESCSEAKELMESSFAPVAQFSKNLLRLSAKLVKMAELAVEAGLDDTKDLDNESEVDGSDDEEDEDDNEGNSEEDNEEGEE